MCEERLFSFRIKNGDDGLYKTNMPQSEIANLPLFPNMYQLKSHFEKRGYWIEFKEINKLAPHLQK